MTDRLAELGLVLQLLNVLVIPCLAWVGKYLLRLELRLSRIEWKLGHRGPNTETGDGP